MKKTTLILSTVFIIFACKPKDKTTIATAGSIENIASKEKHFRGAFTNGMKGDSIFLPFLLIIKH